jgi:hypothetical protein
MVSFRSAVLSNRGSVTLRRAALHADHVVSLAAECLAISHRERCGDRRRRRTSATPGAEDREEGLAGLG